MPTIFKSKPCADLLMLDASAKQLLKIIGKDDFSKGIILAGDIPAAIQALEDAVANEKRLNTAQNDQDQEKDYASHATDKGPSVSLAQRTWPFIEMLQTAHKANEPVVWGV